MGFLLLIVGLFIVSLLIVTFSLWLLIPPILEIVKTGEPPSTFGEYLRIALGVVLIGMNIKMGSERRYRD